MEYCLFSIILHILDLIHNIASEKYRKLSTRVQSSHEINRARLSLYLRPLTQIGLSEVEDGICAVLPFDW